MPTQQEHSSFGYQFKSIAGAAPVIWSDRCHSMGMASCHAVALASGRWFIGWVHDTTASALVPMRRMKGRLLED